MSDLNLNFTVQQLNADFQVDPAPVATLNVQDPMVAEFYVEGTTGGTGTVTQVQGSGSGLGFSLGGNVTTAGNLTLTTPSDTALRTSLNIGNVANANFNGNGSQVLAGNGSWVAQSISTGTVTQVQGDGTGLGFSLSGNVTTTGNISLTVPSASTLRTNLSIGNVANLNLSGNAITYLNGTGTFTGVSINSISGLTIATETVNLSVTTSGVQNFNALTNPIVYGYANATGNITLNIRGNAITTLASSLGVGQSVTCAYLMTTGTTPYVVSDVQVDGSSQAVKYVGNTAPALISNTICSYTYTVIRTSASPTTYVVLGSQTRYG